MTGTIITTIICATIIILSYTSDNPYKKFYQYFKSLYGEGLEVANWHQNGELEPLDNFIDSAMQEMRSKK